jgi:hypothetical protein
MAAHEQTVIRPKGRQHAEIGQEFRRSVEIGRAEADIGDIKGADDAHGCTG